MPWSDVGSAYVKAAEKEDLREMLLPWSNVGSAYVKAAEKEDLSEMLFEVISMMETTISTEALEKQNPKAFAWFKSRKILLEQREQNAETMNMRLFK